MRWITASLLVAAASPLYALGFYVKGGVPAGNFSYGTVSTVMGGIQQEVDSDDSGMLMGFFAEGGLSFAPAPFMMGLSFAYRFGEISGGSVTYTTVGLPLVFLLPVVVAEFHATFQPHYDIFKGKGDDALNGFGFLLSGEGYLDLGSVSLGGGLFFNYVPRLSYSTEVLGTEVKTEIKNSTDVGIRLGVLFKTGILEY